MGYHVTAVRNGSVYGHDTRHCDESGCAGDERCLAHSLDGLLDVVSNDDSEAGSTPLDYTNLPTFGGEEPRDTSNVFSWDAGRLLIQDQRGWRIVPREGR